ncbi:glutamine amidotransferase [Streptomyces sp. SID4919]|nr:glutamine amidotransferase [Streptomyces sp. SID4919]SCK51319.1 Putative intracellular protease/amidase [Streptomyces sp. AmelKG-E11A]
MSGVASTPRKPVHLAVYDTYADWETGHTTAFLARGGYEIRTVGPTRDTVTTLGGLRVAPDLALDELSPADSALLVLTGADLWDTSDDLAPFAKAARAFLDAGVPVAAICGATAGLAREGLLDDRDHTSAVSFYLAATGYAGGARYVDEDAVTDRGLVTAGPTEPVAFAREVLGLTGVFEGEVLDAWYRLFHDSDTAAYEVLTAAAGAGAEAGSGADPGADAGTSGTGAGGPADGTGAGGAAGRGLGGE